MKKVLISLVSLFAMTGLVFAGAATADVNTKSRSGQQIEVGVFTNTIIYAGTIVALNSSGYAVEATDATTNTTIGRALMRVDNRDNNASGSSKSGAQNITIERGVFGWTASGITDATIGSIVFVSDDQTVAASAGTCGNIAGILVDYSDGLAWVDTYAISRLAGSYTTLAASGNATVGGTLAVTGAFTGSSTVGAASYKIGATAGFTGIVTNGIGGASTNRTYFSGGICTNSATLP